jgi:hypothetical protein
MIPQMVFAQPVCSFHIGWVRGPGEGINFGVNALWGENLKVGGELEQLVTDYQNEVNINGTRLGGILTMDFPDLGLVLGVHGGSVSFTASKNVTYADAFNGQNYNLLGDQTNFATYMGASITFNSSDYLITARYFLNTVRDGGRVLEFDLNIGRQFSLGEINIK